MKYERAGEALEPIKEYASKVENLKNGLKREETWWAKKEEIKLLLTCKKKSDALKAARDYALKMEGLSNGLKID